MYFCPSREIRVKTIEGASTYVKSNLSKKGKVYLTRTTLKYLGDKVYSHLLPIHEKDYRHRNLMTVVQSEWVIEEML